MNQHLHDLFSTYQSLPQQPTTCTKNHILNNNSNTNTKTLNYTTNTIKWINTSTTIFSHNQPLLPHPRPWTTKTMTHKQAKNQTDTISNNFLQVSSNQSNSDQNPHIEEGKYVETEIGYLLPLSSWPGSPCSPARIPCRRRRRRRASTQELPRPKLWLFIYYYYYYY